MKLKVYGKSPDLINAELIGIPYTLSELDIWYLCLRPMQDQTNFWHSTEMY